MVGEMNGAESLVRTLIAGGVNVCFTNPGTSEMHFVAALDKVPGMRCVLGLFEGVVTGAADGYYRMLGRPASTLLHLGPGLANGLANLHNAKKASSGIVNIVGEHATYHIAYDIDRSEEHTSELQSRLVISYAVFCLKKKSTRLNSSHALLSRMPSSA